MKLANFFRIPFLYSTPPMADFLKILKNAQKITCIGFCLFDVVAGSENLLKKDCDEDDLL